MLLCRVTGLLVSTVKDSSLQGMKLLVVEQISLEGVKEGRPFVAVDTVGAGEGELVLVVTGGGARETPQTRGKSLDAAVIGIVDSLPERQDGSARSKTPRR